MVSTSESFFQRTLDEKTKQAREAVQNCVYAFLSPSQNVRQSTAAEAFTAVDRLYEMLHEGDRPVWLKQLHSALQIARDNHNNASATKSIQKIANDLQGSLNRHRWQLADVSAVDGFNFDSLYDKYKAENRIPDLFDEIISAMNEIVQSGEIDSVRALEEMQKIIATLQNARDGSYFATRSAWFFVATWFRNTGWELLSEVPVLGAVVRGLRQSLEDMNLGMQNLHDQVQSDLQNQLTQDFPQLEYKSPELPLIEHNSTLGSEESE